MTQSVDIKEITVNALLQVMNDEEFIADFPLIPVVSNVSKQGELEFERRILKKIHFYFTSLLEEVEFPQGNLSATGIKCNEGKFISRIIRNLPEENKYQRLGQILYQVVDSDEKLELVITLAINDTEEKKFYYPFSDYLPYLSVEPNPVPIDNIYSPEPLLVLIDFEWINCFKSNYSSRFASPEQITEYAFSLDDYLYHSDYLQVDENIVKRIHRKLMEKQGLTKEVLLERHKSGTTMREEYERHLAPLWERSRREDKPLIFLYFGREDGEILRQLFPQYQWEYVDFVDFTKLYTIVQLGQEAILKGLGAKFTHTFSPGMDVKVLRVITEVFQITETEEESCNLQNAISIHKMMLETENTPRLSKYQKMIMAKLRTKELYEKALSIVDHYKKIGYFDDLI